MESQVNFVSQKLAFHKEKVARREIALLTSAKTNVRKPKVFIPANEEKPQKYIRKPIDYSILDDIGHGIKIPNTLYRAPSNSSNRMSGTQTLGPKSSMSSLSHYHHYNTLGGSGPAPTTKPPTPPQANRSGFGTLGRSSQNKEYRALAPPIAPPQVPKNYESNYPIGHPKNPMTRQNSGNYSSGGQAQAANQYMPGYGNTSSASLNSNASNQYGQTMHQNMINPTTPPPPPLTQDLSSSSLGTSDLPDPPMHLRGSTHSGYDLHRQSTGSLNLTFMVSNIYCFHFRITTFATSSARDGRWAPPTTTGHVHHAQRQRDLRREHQSAQCQLARLGSSQLY